MPVICIALFAWAFGATLLWWYFLKVDLIRTRWEWKVATGQRQLFVCSNCSSLNIIHPKTESKVLRTCELCGKHVAHFKIPHCFCEEDLGNG